MKLVVTIITVILLFVASMAESGALYLCYLCATNGECPPFAKPVEEPASEPACQPCCEAKAATCGPKQKPEPLPKADSTKRVCFILTLEDGKLEHQCEREWEPPLLISTQADKSTITDGQNLQLALIDSFGIIPKAGPLIISVYSLDNIHPTIASTILRC